MMYARCEGDGTLRLDDDIRSRYGEVFAVVETKDGILLIAAEGDPVKDGKRVAAFLRGEKRDSRAGTVEDVTDTRPLLGILLKKIGEIEHRFERILERRTSLKESKVLESGS